MDGQTVHTEQYETASLLDASSTPFYFEHELKPGDHHLRLALTDNQTKTTFILFDEPVALEAGAIFRYGYGS